MEGQGEARKKAEDCAEKEWSPERETSASGRDTELVLPPVSKEESRRGA